MPRTLWLLVIGMFINVTGASFLWPLNTIYIHQHLGKSLTAAGFVLMLNSGANVLGNLFGGYLFDKIGGFKTVVLGIVITFASLSGLVFFHDWFQYILFLTLAGFGSGIVFPACYAMAGSVWPEGGRKPFNAVYVAQNAGVAVGSALGGIVASFSFTYVFLANAMLYAVFFMIAFFGFKRIRSEKAMQSSVLDHADSVSGKSKFSALLVICTGYLLGWIAYSQWSLDHRFTYPGAGDISWAVQRALDSERGAHRFRSAADRFFCETVCRIAEKPNRDRICHFYDGIRNFVWR